MDQLKSRYCWTFAQLTSLHQQSVIPAKFKVKLTAAVSNDIIELRNFSRLDLNGKHELLARGRPTPTLHELLRLSALAILSIESQRLCKLTACKEEFYSAVIDVFTGKQRCKTPLYRPSVCMVSGSQLIEWQGLKD